jgi:ribosome-binding factor A
MANRSDRRSRDGTARSAGVRGPRLERLFCEELNSILESEINDPNLQGARVSFVELSRDGARARVWFSMSSSSAIEPKELRAAFARASGFLRARLCDALPIKRMPDLSFQYDPAVPASAGETEE